MTIPQIPLAQSILQIFKAKMIKYIVISPGSRNAPLTIGFTSDSFFQCYSIADERSAAFFALGIAQQRKEPVAIVCTSGSAVLNFYPAVAEAFYSQIPLVVVSADRPANKIDIGDGQTIRQANVLSNHTVFDANLTENAGSENDLLIQQALHASKSLLGPVHVNVPFEEPLYETQKDYSYKPEIVQLKIKRSLDEITENHISIWNTAPKKLIVVGTQYPDVLTPKSIEILANDSSVLVLTEITSNLHHPNFIKNIDTLITSFKDQDIKEFQPNLLITFGGMIVSKRIKALLRKYKTTLHWHIDPLRAYDTFGILTEHIKSTPEAFVQSMMGNSTHDSNYQSKYTTILKQKLEKHSFFLKKTSFSDLKVFELLSKYIPSNSHIQISNSASIRYAMLFDFNPSIQVFSNRGTSGIDGSSSTAVGAATTTDKITTLITGDISFFYDSNALWNNYMPSNFKIIVVNNGGGGIFRILPGYQENKTFNTYFETEHRLTARHLASMFGMDYIAANTIEQTKEGLKKIYLEHQRSVILELFTPTKENDKIQKEYFLNLEL